MRVNPAAVGKQDNMSRFFPDFIGDPFLEDVGFLDVQKIVTAAVAELEAEICGHWWWWLDF